MKRISIDLLQYSPYIPAAGLLLGGIVQRLVHDYPTSLEATVGPTWAVVWCWYLIVGALATFAGLYFRQTAELSGRRNALGLSLEVGGLTLLSTATGVHALALAAFDGWGSAVSIGLWGGYSIVAALRAHRFGTKGRP